MTESRTTFKASACPVCGKPAIEAARPFCSRRCADVDLGRWFGEAYRVPSEETPTEDDGDHPPG